MKTGFKSKLKAEFVGKGRGGTYIWKLLWPLSFYSKIEGEVITVPKGFLTNYASVAYKTDPRPAVIHDWYWSLKGVPKSKGNRVFLEAMDSVEDVYGWRRRVRFAAVTLVGQYRDAKKSFISKYMEFKKRFKKEEDK